MSKPWGLPGCLGGSSPWRMRRSWEKGVSADLTRVSADLTRGWEGFIAVYIYVMDTTRTEPCSFQRCAARGKEDCSGWEQLVVGPDSPAVLHISILGCGSELWAAWHVRWLQRSFPIKISQFYVTHGYDRCPILSLYKIMPHLSEFEVVFYLSLKFTYSYTKFYSYCLHLWCIVFLHLLVNTACFVS